MDFDLGATKVTASHLSRNAVVYIRQSTKYQVLNNTASTARQYGMAGSARAYGWAVDKIIINDKDQGLSGASTYKREGFKKLVADIVKGSVGAVFALEASRLARDDLDWQQLVKLCTYTNTLIADEKGIYAGHSINDKMILNMKGMFSMLERYLIKSRLCDARLERAKQGKLRTSVPSGYVYSASKQVVIDPDKKVQALVRLLFEQFDTLGSALAVAKYFHERHIQFPTSFYNGKTHVEYRMGKLLHGRVVKILHNPVYAGIYVYGRRTTVDRASVDEAGLVRVTRHGVMVKPEDWLVVIRDSHEGYLTEEHYQRNQRRLAENRCYQGSEHSGACRPGSGLLQGIARCGVCGNKMGVHYAGRNNLPIYKCVGTSKLEREPKCMFAPASRIDPAVSRCLLESLAPARAEASIGVFERIEAEMGRDIDTCKARVGETERQAEQAERLYLQVASENGRVKATLERRWEEAKKEVEQARQDFESVSAAPQRCLGPEEKESLLKLTGDLPVLWHAPTTTHQDRKELLRLLVKDVVLLRGPGVLKATVRWHSGGRTELEAPWPNFPESNTTDPETVEMIRRLAPTHTDKQIAECLNRKGICPLRAKRFNRAQVFVLRQNHKIHGGNSTKSPDFSGRRADGRFSVKAAAEMLGVATSCVHYLCHKGKLDAIRSTPQSKFWIRLTPEEATRLKKAFRRRPNRADLAGT